MVIMKPYAPLPESLIGGMKSGWLGRLHRSGGWRSPRSAKELALVDARKSLAGEAWEASCEGRAAVRPL